MSVSVIIPAYNAAAYIHTAIESILAQTTPVDEIIVVDDGSTDDTRSVVESLARNHPATPRIRLLTQHNQGPSIARNLGVAEATSDLIALLDADDSWHPRKIEKQLAALAATPHAVLCYTGILELNLDGSETASLATPLHTLPAQLRVGNPAITPSCVLLSRAAYLQAGGFNPTLKGVEDWDLWLALIALGPFCVADEPLTLYQISVTGISANPEHLFNEGMRLVEPRLLLGLHGPARWLWRRRIVSYQAYKAALTARAIGRRSTELRFILQSIATWPSPLWHPRRFKALAITLKNRLA